MFAKGRERNLQSPSLLCRFLGGGDGNKVEILMRNAPRESAHKQCCRRAAAKSYNHSRLNESRSRFGSRILPLVLFRDCHQIARFLRFYEKPS
jgi:hypothetical protein